MGIAAYHQLSRPRPKSSKLPKICIAAGASSSLAKPIEEERLRINGFAPEFAVSFLLLLVVSRSMICDSEVVVASTPFIDFRTDVKLIVRTLNRACDQIMF